MLTEAQHNHAVDGMSADDYHAVDACSSTRLKAMRKAAKVCRHEMDHPKRSEALDFGAAFHAYVLEPGVFAATYAIEPDFGDCRRTANKQARDEWRAANAGKTPLSAEDADAIRGMRDSLMDHPAARSLLALPGHTEISGFWTDPVTGLWCKLRADRVVEVPGFGRVCLDLKSTDDAGPQWFPRALEKWGYAIQAAHYLDGLAKLGISCDAFGIAPVEKAAPHLTAVYLIGDRSVEQGERERRRLMRRYAAAMESGVWAGYSEQIQTIELPAWAFDDDDETF